jgi:hypothetical protein
MKQLESLCEWNDDQGQNVPKWIIRQINSTWPFVNYHSQNDIDKLE